MQVQETKVEGLKREFRVAVPAAEIEQNVTNRLKELARTVRMPGFRPGKVPVSILRKKYGPSVMGEVLEKTVSEASAKVLADRGLRPALQPKIEVESFEEGEDLEYTMAVDVMPEIAPMDFSALELERLVAEVTDSEVDKALERLTEAHRTSRPVKTKRKADKGDIVVIDFVGRVDGEEFAGGRAEDYALELGSGSFIPGFEDQLLGAEPGEAREVAVTFPEDYGAAELAGREAVFEVRVKELQETAPAAIDDDLAKMLGKDSLDDLKGAIREDLQQHYKAESRQRLKRVLLDALAEGHDFDVPEGLVDQEADSIWKQYEEHRGHGHDHEDPLDVDKSDDELKAEFREIAKRRVKLALLLAEVGRQNHIHVSQEEINRRMMAEARSFPGQEQAVIEYYRKTPDALRGLVAPLQEDKVVDFILELVKVSDRKVSLEELMTMPDDEAEAAAKGESKKKKSAKKEPASKEPAKKKSAKKEAAKKEPAKKVPAKKPAAKATGKKEAKKAK